MRVLTRVCAGVLDALLDYPTYFVLTGAFQSTSGDLRDLVATYEDSQASYKNGTFSVGSFLENHDQPRYPSLVHDDAVSESSLSVILVLTSWPSSQLVKNALTWPFVQDGPPILYYGKHLRI